jgi:hypothetical protein
MTEMIFNWTPVREKAQSGGEQAISRNVRADWRADVRGGGNWLLRGQEAEAVGDEFSTVHALQLTIQ